MKHSRFYLVLILILVTGIFLVAESLNRQLCFQAAPVVDARVTGDSIQLAALNVSCSVPIPPTLQSLKEFPSAEVKLFVRNASLKGEIFLQEARGYLLSAGRETAAALEVKGQALLIQLEKIWTYVEKKWNELLTEGM